MRNCLSRRIALKRPKPDEIAALEAEIAATPTSDPRPAGPAALRAELGRCASARKRIPYVDPIDLRYRRFEPYPRPVGAGGDVLPDGRLGLDDRAHEGSRQALLHAAPHLPDAPLPARRDRLHPPHRTRPRRSTRRPSSTAARPAARVVSTALDEMKRVIAERYPPDDWNIYAAQASDGDNVAERQRPTARRCCATHILPLCQYFAYLEVGDEDEPARSGFVERRSDPVADLRGAGQDRRAHRHAQGQPPARHLSRSSANCSRKTRRGGRAERADAP